MVNEVALADILLEALPHLQVDSILLLSSETSLLWLSNPADASHLLTIGKCKYLHPNDITKLSTTYLINFNATGYVALNGNVSAIFAIPENIPSNFIEICPPDASRLLELSVALKELANDATLYVQNSKTLLKFPSQSTAVDFYLNLKASHPQGNLIESVHQVTYGEYSYVLCERQQGTNTERASMERLTNDRRKLRGNCDHTSNEHIPRPLILR